jgi:hypothetical protein
MRFGKHACIGLALDVFDWALIGMIPGVGDVVDIVAVLYWTSKLGPAGLVEALELIPGADILPCNVVLGMMADGRAARGALT